MKLLYLKLNYIQEKSGYHKNKEKLHKTLDKYKPWIDRPSEKCDLSKNILDSSPQLGISSK